jgi:hypothetical protein
MNTINDDSMTIAIDLNGLHPTFVRQARLMQKQIETWFGWKHIAFVLELVETGPYLDENGAHTWSVDDAKKFTTKAEAVSWCGERHIDRKGSVIERSLVEKNGVMKTLDLFDGDHALLEVAAPADAQEKREHMATWVDPGDDNGDIGAVVVSVYRVERPPVSGTGAD